MPGRYWSPACIGVVCPSPRVPHRADRRGALHLGARRVLVIGVGSTSPGERAASDSAVWPSPAQIAGHMLDAIFIDTLDMDLERLQRVNQTLAGVRQDPGSRSSPALKTIDALVIRPTERMDVIA